MLYRRLCAWILWALWMAAPCRAGRYQADACWSCSGDESGNERLGKYLVNNRGWAFEVSDGNSESAFWVVHRSFPSRCSSSRRTPPHGRRRVFVIRRGRIQSLVDVDAKPRLKPVQGLHFSVFGVFRVFRVFRVHPDDRAKGQCLSLVANQFL